ncbi:MAG: ATP-binding protein [Elusimicrobiota bacterium]
MNTLPERFRSGPEGQFLERKSCFNKRAKTPKPLLLKNVSAEIAETLVAFANADGGELVVGLDDDGTPSGLPFNDKQLAKLIEISSSRINPPLSAKPEICLCGSQKILLFETGPSLVTHRTTAGQYLYRDHDKNMPMDADRIAHAKALKKQSLTEHALVPGAGMADLREDLVHRVAEKFRPGIPAKQALIELRLAEPQNGDARLSFAALLLFANDPERWHEKAYVEYIRFRGIQREHGANLNIVQRERISAPLAELSEKVVEKIKPHIGQRQVLHDLFFSENAEYPQFAWQEAVVNALAHRDYGLRGTPVEIHHYDDRLEVVSPGSLVPPITLDVLRKGVGGHASRNPLIVRVMVIAGLMREVGEGVPRMFEVMEDNGLHRPEFTDKPHGFITVSLRNSMVWDEGTRAWLAKFKDKKLSQNQIRLLAMARQQDGRFTSAQYQKLVGIDIYSASQDIKELIRKELVRLEKKGGRIYVLAWEGASAHPQDFEILAKEMAEKGRLANSDLRRIWGLDRQSALRRAKALLEAGWLMAKGNRRGRYYLAGPKVR